MFGFEIVEVGLINNRLLETASADAVYFKTMLVSCRNVIKIVGQCKQIVCVGKVSESCVF